MSKMKDSFLDTDLEMRNGSIYRKLLSMALTTLVVSAERVTNFFYFRKTKTHIFLYWLESCITSLFLVVFLWRTKSLRLSSVSKWSFLSLCGSFLLYTAIDGSALNVFHNCSGGSEIHQIGLAVSPVAVMVMLRWTSQKEFGDKLFIAMAACSVLLLVIFCSESDGYVQYYFSLKVTVLGVICGTALGAFSVILGQLLKHNTMTFKEVLFYINCSCVVLLPIAFLLTGELRRIWSYEMFSTKSFMGLVSSVITMAFIRSLHLASFFNQISLSSPLLCIATANVSWIISTLVITFAFKMELLISTFEAFWVVGLVFIIVTLCHFSGSTKDSSPNSRLLEH